MSLSEIDTGVSAPEDELVRAELDEARRKRRTGRARIVGTAALPGLSYFARRASRVTLASTALSVIAPGGAAAGMATTVAMLRACGFSGRPVGLAIVVMSVWNQSVILGFPILAVAGLAAAGARNRTLEIAALVGLAVFAVIVAGYRPLERAACNPGRRPPRVLSPRLGASSNKAPVKWNGASFVHFRDESIELIRGRWLFLTAAGRRAASSRFADVAT